MSVEIHIYEALKPGEGIKIQFDRNSDDFQLVNAISRPGDNLYGDTWPDALYEVEEFVSGLRREASYRRTLTQAYDDDTQTYVPNTGTNYWFQVVTERGDYYPLTRTHVIHLQEINE